MQDVSKQSVGHANYTEVTYRSPLKQLTRNRSWAETLNSVHNKVSYHGNQIKSEAARMSPQCLRVHLAFVVSIEKPTDFDDAIDENDAWNKLTQTGYVEENWLNCSLAIRGRFTLYPLDLDLETHRYRFEWAADDVKKPKKLAPASGPCWLLIRSLAIKNQGHILCNCLVLCCKHKVHDCLETISHTSA